MQASLEESVGVCCRGDSMEGDLKKAHRVQGKARHERADLSGDGAFCGERQAAEG